MTSATIPAYNSIKTFVIYANEEFWQFILKWALQIDYDARRLPNVYTNGIFNGVPQSQHDSNHQPIKKRPHSIIVLPLILYISSALCVYVHIFLGGKTNSKKKKYFQVNMHECIGWRAEIARCYFLNPKSSSSSWKAIYFSRWIVFCVWGVGKI